MRKKKYSQKIFKGLIHYFFSQISVLLFNKFFHTSKQLSVAKVSSTNHQMSLPWHHDRFLETGQMWGSFSLRLKWWESQDWMCSATDLAVPAPNIGFQVIKVPMFSLIHLFVCVCVIVRYTALKSESRFEDLLVTHFFKHTING